MYWSIQQLIHHAVCGCRMHGDLLDRELSVAQTENPVEVCWNCPGMGESNQIGKWRRTIFSEDGTLSMTGFCQGEITVLVLGSKWKN